MTKLDNLIAGEIIDTRDLIEAAAEYDDVDLEKINDEDHRETVAAIREIEDCCADWRYGETMIRADHFTKYAQELAEDIGAIDANACWPLSFIDWEAAATELQMDYTQVEFLGYTYYVRS